MDVAHVTGYRQRMAAVFSIRKACYHARRDVRPVVRFWKHSGGSEPDGKGDFFWRLWRTRCGGVEPVRVLAGIVEVRNGKVPALEMSLGDARVRIEGAVGVADE